MGTALGTGNRKSKYHRAYVVHAFTILFYLS
mgnify:CR=1 FL=1